MSDISRKPDRHKWDGAVGIVWLLAVISILSAIVVIATYGVYEVKTGGLYSQATETRFDIVIWTACISQALGMLMVALLFSILRGIYQNTCDALSMSADHQVAAGEPEKVAAPSLAAKAAQGRGVVVGYVNETSPLHGIVEPGHAILRINSTEVTGVRQAAGCLTDGENKISFLDHQGHLLDRYFQSAVGASLNIRSA